MSQAIDSGLHPVQKALPNPYSDLPQVYQPVNGPETAPQLSYSKSAIPSDAPEVVGAPPLYVASPDTPKAVYLNEDEKPTHHAASPERRILGMKRKTAIIVGIIALIVIIAIAVGVGAGVGTSQRNRNVSIQDANSASNNSTSSSSSSSSIATTITTPTSTVKATTSKHASTATTSMPVATSGFEGMAEVKCPGINNTEITSGSSRFQVRCAVHWPNNSPAENNNGTVKAVGGNKLVAYTLEECLQHCVDYNAQNGGADPTENGSGCLAVTYNADLTSSFSKFAQNCFLKDRVGTYDPAADTTESAVLVGV